LFLSKKLDDDDDDYHNFETVLSDWLSKQAQSGGMEEAGLDLSIALTTTFTTRCHQSSISWREE